MQEYSHLCHGLLLQWQKMDKSLIKMMTHMGTRNKAVFRVPVPAYMFEYRYSNHCVKLGNMAENLQIKSKFYDDRLFMQK